MKLKVSNECEKAVVEFHVLEAFGVITFGKFFKGFELLWRWTMKHHFGAIDYYDLDFEDW